MTSSNESHEDFTERSVVNLGSERAFALVFTVVLTIFGAFPLINGKSPNSWAFAAALFFLSAGCFFPSALRPLNMLWFRLGMLLHKIVNPLIMGLLFFITITPIAMIMRLVGKDPLNRQFDPNIPSYWIKRDKDELQPETMRYQF